MKMLSCTENSCRPYPGYLSLTSTGACLRKGCKLWSINRISAHFTMETIAQVNSVLFKTVAGTAPDTSQIREITCLTIAHGVEELSLARSQSHYSPWLALRLRWAVIIILISKRVHLQEENIGCIGMLFPGPFYYSVSEKNISQKQDKRSRLPKEHPEHPDVRRDPVQVSQTCRCT